MTELEFLENLKKLVLPLETYKTAGVSGSFIKMKQKLLQVSPRKHHSKNQERDPVIRLVDQYNVENIIIGMVEFKSGARRTPAYTFFGKFEVDDLAIDNSTKEIIILEEGIDHKLWVCAGNSAVFLDALIHIGSFLTKRVVDNNLYEDEAINLAVAEQTAEIAGGEKYFNFYRTMLGV